ncbi:hypothetical protein LHP98_08200 [Rhodobacter sp. Har01]|uniref:hypothetical protein n=1 Tax=Rhodobacter sp. Har01 TaxID=2883999 RepID=UPI001D0740AA|nr:hypothetical protein [Rhodobacter sp. Har01]MCB6178110.1 hypothetical protein [Rhodobacter sp. Har01]
MTKTIAFALLAAVMAAPALAGSWTPPEGCELFMTVQSKACRVSNHYRCAGDPAGDQWRADFDQEGMYFQSHINSEAEWVESFDLNPTVRQVLDPGAEDPASFSELLATGVDTYAFGLTRDDGTHSNVTGADRLTGKTVVIDGQTLEQTEFDYTETDDFGNVLRRSRGNEYISRDMRLFFAGPGETDLGDGQWLPSDGRPMDFAFPGDKGFGATQPIFDCDAVLSLTWPQEGDRVF